jgi:hypothetical protein
MSSSSAIPVAATISGVPLIEMDDVIAQAKALVSKAHACIEAFVLWRK